MDEVLKNVTEIELQLRAERMELLSLLRDERERSLLLMMLENNVNSVRRLRSIKETILVQSVKDDEEELEDDDENEEDEAKTFLNTCFNCGYFDRNFEHNSSVVKCLKYNTLARPRNGCNSWISVKVESELYDEMDYLK